ncbi:MAG: helix-turn-helix transcriptional regulator [Acidobacteriia bacterium]|nr:helix-turn-helix transcriptional regulator [Terriglobia bacterium]
MQHNIKTRRNTLKTSLVELSIASRVSQGRLSYIERGIMAPTPEELERIEDALAALRLRQLARVVGLKSRASVETEAVA